MEWIELEWVETGDLGPDRTDYVAWHGDKKVARVYIDKVKRRRFLAMVRRFLAMVRVVVRGSELWPR